MSFCLCVDEVISHVIHVPPRAFSNLISLLDGPPSEISIKRDFLSQAGGTTYQPDQFGNCGFG